MSGLFTWTHQTLADLGTAPKKALGQNFLIDPSVVDRIVALIDPQPDDQVVEIGGGLGVLTRPLADRVARLVIFELDDTLRPHLAKTLAGTAQVHFLPDAIADWDRAAPLLDPARPVKIAGNIPYQITGALLERVVANQLGAGWETITLMVQREVADRMLAAAGDTERGKLSVFVEFHTLPGRRFPVSREAFYPKPNVDSTVLQLRPRPVPLLETHELPVFDKLLERGFHMRRKTIWNNLREGLTNEQAAIYRAGYEANGLDLTKRPQDWDLRSWLKAFWVERELKTG
ncbi:MAG: 16S rRNA (adenine(1518)-N(6)/adenine(1519)-N(6))-dimethyltransferase RsmA [bacterium]